METKANSLTIELLGNVEETKNLEQFILVSFVDTDTGVFDRYLNHAVALRLHEVRVVLLQRQIVETLDKLACDDHWATLRSELQGIALDVQQDLLDTQHVRANDKSFREIQELEGEVNALMLGFENLNINNLLDSYSYVEVTQVFSEFAASHLGKIEHVIYQEA